MVWHGLGKILSGKYGGEGEGHAYSSVVKPNHDERTYVWNILRGDADLNKGIHTKDVTGWQLVCCAVTLF